LKNFRLAEKMFIRIYLIIFLIPLQSCSNTLIGEKLENSFDIADTQLNSVNTSNGKNKLNGVKKINQIKTVDNKSIRNIKTERINEDKFSSKDKVFKNVVKPVNKVIFTPQPYRIILKLSGANPSAPAETVTKALRKAGVKFEVEKIERFDEESFLKKPSSKR
tara:strand:+ start:1402 stop:1890 length:489 start_codon:yes stop_codon:yes gene_type:complete